MRTTITFLKIAWASPYSLIGLFVGAVGLCTGGSYRCREGTIGFFGGGTKWVVNRLPNGQFVLAMTLGHVIIGQSEASLEISHSHEMVHVRQFELWGPLMGPAYFASSFHMWIIGRRAYRDNYFERQAYDIDGGEIE